MRENKKYIQKKNEIQKLLPGAERISRLGKRWKSVCVRAGTIISAFVFLGVLAGVPAGAAEINPALDPGISVSTDAENFSESRNAEEENSQTPYCEGKITVRLLDGTEGIPVDGIRFYCTRAADLRDGEYVLTEQYQRSGVDLNTVSGAAELGRAAEKLAGYAADTEEAETLSGVTDQNGEAVFSGLSSGVYLIRGEDDPEYDLITPALAAVPTFNEDTGEMEYAVVVEPKHTPRAENGKNTAPQTGLEDAYFQYFAGGVLCVAGAVLLILLGCGKRRYEK